MNIYYLGPDGSYSHILVKKVFTAAEKLIPCTSFIEVISAVQTDPSGVGVLAIENSISSSVHQTVDLLYTSTACIVGEASMTVHMNLIGTSESTDTSIRHIYSHPQAIAQCSDYIQKHRYIIHEMQSTSQAVAEVLQADDPTIAAIGSADSIEGTKLTIIADDIANVQNNMTRWVFIAQEGASLGKKTNKLTYIFKVKHEPGSLVKVLTEIAKLEGNMTKIESRPLPGTHWEYGFWTDIEIDEKRRAEFDAMMKEVTLECRCVGAYQKGELFT